MRAVAILVAGWVIGCLAQLTFAQTEQPEASNSSAATPATPAAPAAAATPATSATAAQAPAQAAPAAPAAEATLTTEPSDAEKTAAHKEAIDTRGYQQIERGGVKYYCSNTPVLGSRLKSRTTCMTLEQLQRARQEAQDKLREKQGQRTTKEG